MVVIPVKCLECKWFRTLDPEECSKHCEECKVDKELKEAEELNKEADKIMKRAKPLFT